MDRAQHASTSRERLQRLRMTAPAINAAMNASPGLTGGGSAQAAIGLRFGEALRPAQFGDTAISGVVAGELRLQEGVTSGLELRN